MSKHVGIFWDYSSCPSDDTKDRSSIATSLREGCIKHGKVTLFKAYFGLPGNTPYEQPPASIRSEIEEVGVVTVDNPKTGFGALATDVFCFLLDHHDLSASITVVFVSGNPDMVYLVSALRARGVRVGLITPVGRSNNLSSQASWVGDWNSYATASESSGLFSHQTGSMLTTLRHWPATAASVGSNSDYSLVDGTPSTCEVKNSAMSSSSLEAKPETTEAPQAPAFTYPSLPPLKFTYPAPIKPIGRPLKPPVSQFSQYWGSQVFVTTTTSHGLQMFEDDPLYAELIKDPEAIKIKTWRRKLKQIFFFPDISTNPKIQNDLDTVFTSLEQYDKMSKNYLAFSRICKLLTQISQHYLQQFDYRQSCIMRARQLLEKWEPLACS
ncbi:hypothetical protein ACGC1H_000851 [Rhizoctonia solani]|uniref:NYN domain-containing protein n=1 Tax=Rhizoctonia solani TaxID=456999 RepID=A0A8H3H2D8_9AGAM|nr:unnamed protein product [Rhizoctonia solani]